MTLIVTKSATTDHDADAVLISGYAHNFLGVWPKARVAMSIIGDEGTRTIYISADEAEGIASALFRAAAEARNLLSNLQAELAEQAAITASEELEADYQMERERGL